MDLTHMGYCGVDCAVCPDYLSGRCPDCRRSVWPEGEACSPVACCQEKGLDCCGQCGAFPCENMAAFYEESEGHRAAYARMKALGGGNEPC